MSKEGVEIMARKRKTSVTAENSFWKFIAFGGFTVLLFYPPFFRGLFFQGEQQWALIFAMVLFAATWLGKFSQRDLSFADKPLDILVLGLVLVYVISAFHAANTRLAIAEVIKYALYFLVFWLSAQLVRNFREIKILLHAIYLAGIGVAMAGIMCASGMIYIKDGFIYGRIYSTMQYPNALASYLAALSFIGMYLWMQGRFLGPGPENKAKRQKPQIFGYLYAVGNYILLLIYIGTGSRGGLLVYPVVLAVFFIGLPRGYRLPVFCHFVITLIAAVTANFKLMPDLVAGNAGGAWTWFFIGVLIAVLGQVLFSLGSRIKVNKRWAGFAALAVLTMLMVFGWLQVKDTEAAAKLLPDHLITSFRKINLADRNVQERFVFWQDALKIVQEHPVFGLGGGAFEETFRRYQSYFYSSTQAHNHYIQMWTEVGTVGLLVFLGIWFCYFFTVGKLLWKKIEVEGRLLVWSMFSTALALGMHAFLDFDLSLSSIAIVLFAMFGLTRGMERMVSRSPSMSRGKFAQLKWFYQVGVGIVTLIVLIFIFRLNLGMSEAKAAAQAYNAKDFNLAKTHFEKAVKYDPWNPDFQGNLAKTYLNLKKNDQAVAVITEAAEQNPYNVQILGDACTIFWNVGDQDKSLEYLEQSVLNFPFNVSLWEQLNYRYFIAGFQAARDKKQDAAVKMMEQAARIPDRVEVQMSGVTDQYKKMWATRVLPVMEVTPAINLYSGAAKYLLNDQAGAEKNIKFALENGSDDKTKGEAAMWLAALYTKEGKADQAEEVAQVGEKLLPDFQDNVRALLALEMLKK